jgi:ABC-type multidrug transport system ATPase subunit
MKVELRDVTFFTGDVPLLEDISCVVDEGQCVLVMGPSGSGKTLLMKIMAGILPPGKGDVLFDGTSMVTMPDRELDRTRLRQGFVFQDSALWQNLSVLANLTLATQYHYPQRDAASVQARVDRVRRMMGFTDNLNQRPALLSSGERKMVSIMRALMLDPEMFFMDEPSGGLDSATTGRLISVLKELKSRHRTLVISSHNSEIASQLADWILVVDEGRLLAYDSVQNLVRTEDTRVREILADVFDLSSTYDADILDILGSGDDPFA